MGTSSLPPHDFCGPVEDFCLYPNVEPFKLQNFALTSTNTT